MRATRIIQSVALSAFVVFGTDVSPSIAAISPVADVVMPEVTFRLPTQPYCIYRIELTAQTLEKRRSDFLNLLGAANLRTRGWQVEFVIAGVDYADFTYFHAVSYSPCGNQNSLHALDLSQASASRPTVAEVSRLVSSVDVRQRFISRAQEFVFYRSQAVLGQCLAELTAADLNRSSQIQSFILEAAETYRMPIADVQLWNDKVYVVFGRECDRKRDLYAELVFLAKRQGFDMTNNLKRAEFDPKLQSYLEVAQSGLVK